MAYFIHNKYDSNSSSKVTHVSGTSYTYKEDPSVTVIDFFGNIETGVNTYRNLDTTYMGIQTIEELVYTTIDEGSLIGNKQTTDGKSNISFSTGALPILEALQIALGQKTDTGGSPSDGTVMAKLNELISKFINGVQVIKRIQRGVVTKKDNEDSSHFTITIEPVNPAKCFVILDSEFTGASGTAGDSRSTEPVIGAQLQKINTNNIIISPCNYYNDSGFSSSRGTNYGGAAWQVIEFY